MMPDRREEAISEALAFLEACVLASPQRRFAGLFGQETLGRTPRLEDSLAEGIAIFASDLERWNRSLERPKEFFERLSLLPNLQASYFYRVSHALFAREVDLLPDVIAAVARWMTGAEIYYSAEMGPGLKVIHGLGTVIGARCRIGSHFTVYGSVTIGDRLGRQTGLDKRPIIGEHVIVSAGAVVLGPISIGDQTIIGANSVVIDSLPGRCIAAGVPARVKVENLSDSRFREFWAAVGG